MREYRFTEPRPAVHHGADCKNCEIEASCDRMCGECHDNHACGGYYHDDGVPGYRCDICDEVYQRTDIND